MAERRPLGAAILLTPEKQAFIQHGVTPSAITPEPAARLAPVEPVRRGSETDQESSNSDTTVSAGPHPARRRSPRHPPLDFDRQARRSAEPQHFYGTILVPLTTRLQPRTAEALRRACLEQKLACRTPNTQQEIVELALDRWLNEHQFLE